VLLLLTMSGMAAAAPGQASSRAPAVTLDVKDADVRDILKSMQQQCGVKNLLIDKDVSGAGTIYFRGVACTTAFRVVLAQFGLTGQVEPHLVTVERTR
jgi:type II secretory pathway component GspD/PulD (secretin)